MKNYIVRFCKFEPLRDFYRILIFIAQSLPSLCLQCSYCFNNHPSSLVVPLAYLSPVVPKRAQHSQACHSEKAQSPVDGSVSCRYLYSVKKSEKPNEIQSRSRVCFFSQLLDGWAEDDTVDLDNNEIGHNKTSDKGLLKNGFFLFTIQWY